MKEEIIKILDKNLSEYYNPGGKEKAAEEIIELFGKLRKYRLDYLDCNKVEQLLTVWATNEDDALDKLKEVCSGATYIFIKKL